MSPAPRYLLRYALAYSCTPYRCPYSSQLYPNADRAQAAPAAALGPELGERALRTQRARAPLRTWPPPVAPAVGSLFCSAGRCRCVVVRSTRCRALACAQIAAGMTIHRTCAQRKRGQADTRGVWRRERTLVQAARPVFRWVRERHRSSQTAASVRVLTCWWCRAQLSACGSVNASSAAPWQPRRPGPRPLLGSHSRCVPRGAAVL